MALTYGFFNAELSGSGQYDRVYAAEQFAEYFSLFIKNGVFPTPATQLQVTANSTPNMAVYVNSGFGWINGYYAKNSGPYPLAVQAADGALNRIDAVVLRWVNASREIELAVKKGVVASTPEVPALQRDENIYELMLATITIPAGATNITQSQITDKRPDESVCGWVTGAVQNIDTTNLFAQYDTAFHEWFDDVKSQLEGDVATNLLNRIQALEEKEAADIAALEQTKLNISDAATSSEIEAGTINNKYVSPAGLRTGLNASSIHLGWRQFIARTVPGSFTGTFPDLFGGKSYTVGVIAIGGGGSGGLALTSNITPGGVASGGGSGRATQFTITVLPGSNYSGKVGKGGAAITSSKQGNIHGNEGEQTTVRINGHTYYADGGEGGYANTGNETQCTGAAGGQASTYVYAGYYAFGNLYKGSIPFGGMIAKNVTSNYSNNPSQMFAGECVNHFTLEPLLYAGGSVARSQNGVTNVEVQNSYSYLSGGTVSYGGTDSTSVAPTKPGAGGGGRLIGGYTSGTTYYAPAGANGAVLFYVLG